MHLSKILTLEINKLLEIFQNQEHYSDFISHLKDSGQVHANITGVSGSAKPLIAANTFVKTGNTHLAILSDKEEAAFFLNDIAAFTGEENTYFFPSSYRRSIQYQQTESSNLILRTAALNSISNAKTSQNGTEKNIFVITYPEAIIEKVITHSKLSTNTLKLIKGEQISIEFIEDVLREYGFQAADFVYEPGQYSIRGSIVDIFSFSNDFPYRIDFFGDEVDSIRTFDVDNQRSKENLNKITIVPNVQDVTLEDVKETLFEFIPENTVIWAEDVTYIVDRLNDLYNSTNFIDEENQVSVDKESLITTGHHVMSKITGFKTIEFSSRTFMESSATFEFNISSQPRFNKNFDLLGSTLVEHQQKGYKNFILSDYENQIDRISSIFENIEQNVQFTPILKTLHEGFIDHDLKICCFTDHQIFDRYHKFKIHRSFDKKASLTIKELTGLKPGDFVVHVDHGIGIFGGLEKTSVNGKPQESIRLVYKDNDVIFVSIHSLHRISKYKGKEGVTPKVYKLGSAAWQKLKQNTKKKVKDIARELISLYAKRKSETGFSFTGDSYLQHELEASFIYEDTPDQEKATQLVKGGMESPYPMDTLVCGDVGFGKTEIAIRAAFKAVADNKQVAVLVPTTILALQHYNTFSERLKEFPCTIDYVSRLKPASKQKEAIQKLSDGRLDIIIGTHRLVGRDIKFKDLGLLIIDEEQKFGVAVKEKLKTLKINVDTLTLTATPIPRTLQFSLMGARDLAIINTPPPNRHPIITELYSFNEDIIKEGITYEISRGGQVFFINNRVQNIMDVEAMIKRICPEVSTVVAHGQMDGPKLEKIMLDFISGDYDVLIATTIIESGLDIPNANTIFINNAQNFGLSDLHQLRGRVGRSNKKAFCYLLAPPLTAVTPEARRRLKAIEEYSELGSGFNIAMQDLDIRGAGNLLGGEQSGFIADIGLETYQRILNEAMLELKEEEFKDLFAKPKDRDEEDEEIQFVTDCIIDTDMELLFPDNYIHNITERLRLYRELDNIETEEALEEFKKSLEDRFGPLPQPTEELLQVVRLRWLGIKLGIEKMILKNRALIVYFASNQNSPFYKSATFSRILHFLQYNPGIFSMKEGKNKLSMSAKKVKTIFDAIKLLAKVKEKDHEPHR